jgi:hypothetical protein
MKEDRLRIGDLVFERALPLAFRRRSRAGAGREPSWGHVAFKVDDVRGVVDRVREAGWETAGEIVDFENTFLLCYVRGPEGPDRRTRRAARRRAGLSGQSEPPRFEGRGGRHVRTGFPSISPST